MARSLLVPAVKMKWLVCFSCTLIACGGQVEVPPDGSGSGTSSPDPGASVAGRSSTSAPNGQRRLGECKPGFARSDSSRSCDWLGTDGLCYASKDEACNCVCPRDHDSQCISGFFDGPGRATKVICN